MTMPAEHAEAEAQLAKERQTQAEVVGATVDNSRSITEVNRALVKVHEARAGLRQAFAVLAFLGGVLAVGWSVWAMVHWA